MSRIGPSQAKNSIRRALYGALDRRITELELNKLWHFFESRCAYCGKRLDRSKREGHVDHLLAVAHRGDNNISNCVLACAECNGDKKREMDWDDFLREVNQGKEFAKRRDRIIAWRNLHKDSAAGNDEALNALVEAQVSKVIETFDYALEQIRGMKNGRD